MAVLRNAIAPMFERSNRERTYFFTSERPPMLLYTRTPFRGLNVLLEVFPRIRALIPGCEAKIFLSMAVYQSHDSYRSLYDLCRTTEGVHYMGSIGQDELVEVTKHADVFAYPNTFPETSCIALMEAMASGCMIVSSELGALPETAAGFGSLCKQPAKPFAVSRALRQLYRAGDSRCA
jgi:glycosyltransferase involved in cell wall biosynthesis